MDVREIAIIAVFVALVILLLCLSIFTMTATKSLKTLTSKTEVALDDINNKLAKIDGLFDTLYSVNQVLQNVASLASKVKFFEKVMNMSEKVKKKSK